MGDIMSDNLSYEIKPCKLIEILKLCEEHHGYGSCGRVAVAAFGVYEDNRIVAGYAWQPPAPGAAKGICPEAPYAVLALSRMVAVPRSQRALNHVSKPLRRQMSVLLDRGRWPVLVTYSDDSLGHTGHVYLCSGWQKVAVSRVKIFKDHQGNRVSRYNNGNMRQNDLEFAGFANITRWEKWACERGHASEWVASHGWRREPIPGKKWSSGNQAYRFAKA